MSDWGHRTSLLSTGKYTAYICRYGPEPCGTMCTLDYWHGNFRENATTPSSLNISYHVTNVNILRWNQEPLKGTAAWDESNLSKARRDDLKYIIRFFTEIWLFQYIFSSLEYSPYTQRAYFISRLLKNIICKLFFFRPVRHVTGNDKDFLR
jgi:hypothetical protein